MRIYPVVFRLLGTEEKQVILGLNLDIKSLSSYHLQLSFFETSDHFKDTVSFFYTYFVANPVLHQ